MTELVTVEVADSDITLPVDKRTLGEFIAGLLGQPQTLERRFESAFSVDHQWLIHFCSLLFQRIQQQNAPEPLAFEVLIRYRDKIERKIATWAAFQHFSETQSIVSIGVKFNLAFLIHFPTKQAPERQELIIDFDAGDFQQSFFESLIGRDDDRGNISVEIRHTERTWADDILRIIETELRNVQVAENKFKRNLRKAFFPFFALLFPVTMMASLLYTQWSQRQSGADLSRRIAGAVLKNKLDLSSINEKLNLLLLDAERSTTGKFSEVAVPLIFMVVGLIVFLSGVFLARPNPSFVLLSKAAENDKKKKLERLRRKNFWLLASMIGSIILGVVGNFVYDHIK